nr:PilZ domain-containing protein [Terrihabitans soli]
MHQAQSAPKQRPEERRRHARVKVALIGRYMLSDRCEYPCQTLDISPGGLSVIAPVLGKAGERVVAYFDHIGRVEGVLVRVFQNGFAMTIAATPRKREKLADQLTWLANRQILGLPEDRRHERLAPKQTRSFLILPDGREIPCRVVDVSLSGAAVQIEEKPPVGTAVTLGRTAAKIVRHLETGLAVEFTRPQNIDVLREQFGG